VLVAGTDDKAHMKPVQAGIRNTELTQVISGISAGDPVITAGGYAVPDGTQIKIEQPGAEGKEAADKGDDKSDKKDDKADKKAGATAKPADKGKE
jgi:hypothetical protein